MLSRVKCQRTDLGKSPDEVQRKSFFCNFSLFLISNLFGFCNSFLLKQKKTTSTDDDDDR